MSLSFILLVLLVAIVLLALTEGQVVFRPHFLYKQKQAEKAEKENKRRQEILAQQQIESRPDYYDPYYYYYYQNQASQIQNSNNYYLANDFAAFQQRSKKDRRSLELSFHPTEVRLASKHFRSF